MNAQQLQILINLSNRAFQQNTAPLEFRGNVHDVNNLLDECDPPKVLWSLLRDGLVSVSLTKEGWDRLNSEFADPEPATVSVEERRMLERVYHSCYHDGNPPVGNWTWLFEAEADTHAKGAVLTNLQKRGFLEVDVQIPRRDSGVRITRAGADAIGLP